jgi:hypothetical protein
VKPLLQILQIIGRDLDRMPVPWALIGGLAVGVLGAVRFTKDVDLVLAVDSDRAAERVVYELRQLGYELLLDEPAFDHLTTDRLAMVRLRLPERYDLEQVVDLFFALSGIEAEIVEAARPWEVSPGVAFPVASRGDLMALKVQAGRAQDHRDFRWLLAKATPRDLARARSSLDLIERRGYGEDLREDFDRVLALGPEEP